MTRELMEMLGVRREGVTYAIGKLHRWELFEYSPAQIR